MTSSLKYKKNRMKFKQLSILQTDNVKKNRI